MALVRLRAVARRSGRPFAGALAAAPFSVPGAVGQSAMMVLGLAGLPVTACTGLSFFLLGDVGRVAVASFATSSARCAGQAAGYPRISLVSPTTAVASSNHARRRSGEGCTRCIFWV